MSRPERPGAVDGLRATRFDVAVLGLTPLLAFATTSNSFSMETVFPLTVVLVWRHVVRSSRYHTPIGSRWTALCLFGFVWLGVALLVNLFVDPERIGPISLVRWWYVGSALAFYCVATAPRFTRDDLLRALRLGVVSGVLISLAIVASFVRGATGTSMRMSTSGAAAVGAGVGMLLLFLLSYRFTAASTVRLVVGAGLAAGAGWLILSRLPAWTVDRILHNSYADDSNLRGGSSSVSWRASPS